MKKLIAAMLALTLLVAFASTAALAYTDNHIGEFTATDDPAWVRSGPGLEYDIIDSVSAGCTRTYWNQVEYDSRGVAWYLTYCALQTGWVSSLQGYLTIFD